MEFYRKRTKLARFWLLATVGAKDFLVFVVVDDAANAAQALQEINGLIEILRFERLSIDHEVDINEVLVFDTLDFRNLVFVAYRIEPGDSAQIGLWSVGRSNFKIGIKITPFHFLRTSQRQR